jgi:four helix bundle protein
MKRNNYEDLRVWQASVDISVKIYEITERFPKSEQYGITNQIRRSSVSIPSNIAEGSERNSNKEFGQFLSIAKGSLAELKTQLIIANRILFLDKNGFEELKNDIESISKMLTALRKAIRNKSDN